MSFASSSSEESSGLVRRRGLSGSDMVTNLGLYKTLGKGDSIEHRTLDELPQAIYLRGRSSPGSGRAISPITLPVGGC